MKICWMRQLTNITDSAMRDGCISQMVKEELCEKWLNFTNNQKGVLWAFGDQSCKANKDNKTNKYYYVRPKWPR